MELTSPVDPALKALAKVRSEAAKRVGKEGGNLNEKFMSWCDVIEATLMQIEPLGNMMKVVNQQSELVIRAMKDLSRIALPPASNGDELRGDDGTSQTKGQ